MKTIMVIISGIADLPDKMLGGKTPLMLAPTPALDLLAKCGCAGTMRVIPENVELSRNNAILSLLGYDFAKGIPSAELLSELGDDPRKRKGGLAPRYFVIPKFSGHGILMSVHSDVRGIGRLALLDSIDPNTLREEGESLISCMARAAIGIIESEEFVVIHVESPASMSRRHDPDGKQKVLSRIDRELISPIADYVWSSRHQMNMVVTTDCIYPWRLGAPVAGEVPTVVYFNDDLPYDTQRFDEVALEEGPLNTPLPGDLMKFLVSFDPLGDS